MCVILSNFAEVRVILRRKSAIVKVRCVALLATALSSSGLPRVQFEVILFISHIYFSIIS
jgi:hypothetical protein